MIDSTFLNWPFFADEHREFRKELNLWAEQEIVPLLTKHPSENPNPVSRKFVSMLGEAGWLTHVIPAPYGGKKAKLDVRTICIGRETLAYYSGLLEFGFAMQGLGAGPISFFGSEEQRKKYLPEVAHGRLISAFAMSEHSAGSDVAAIETSAVIDGDHYVLNGEKAWISNAGIADFYVILARTGEGPRAKGLSAFLVDADNPGCVVSQQIAISAPHPLGSLSLRDCRIPRANLIGESGRGFKVAMATLDVFRTTVGAAALGFARRAFEEALAHATSRELYGQKLADFQMSQERIADMATEIDASALLVYRAAWTKDQGAERVTREASMAKMYSTEASQKIIDTSLQLLGGKGVVKDSVLEHLYRDIRPLRIYEGATEVQKLVIAKQVLDHV